MDYITLILLSVGLAMDCFAVSVAKSAVVGKIQWSWVLFMAFMFGLFQGGMPLIGYLIGNEFIDYINSFDHWIAFAMLTAIGIKMIIEDIKPSKENTSGNYSYEFGSIVLLSFATSIDALASGLVFLSYPDSLVEGIIIIAIGSFLLSLIGSLLGTWLGKTIKFKFGVLGGIILIAIGVKIVLEHCCATCC